MVGYLMAGACAPVQKPQLLFVGSVRRLVVALAWPARKPPIPSSHLGVWVEFVVVAMTREQTERHWQISLGRGSKPKKPFPAMAREQTVRH